MYQMAVDLNRDNIVALLERDMTAKLLDLGCDDGSFTMRLARRVETSDINGVEILRERSELAVAKGIKVKNFNLNGGFDFPDEFFDAIHANQVIEHLYNSDGFLAELRRVLKTGGYAVISTENGSSWCNIFAAIMGWQIFSLTNITNKKLGVGNPFALHRGGSIIAESWNHIRIYNIRGLKELLEAYEFKVEDIKGAGYFPLPAWFGNLDKIHCHYMTFKIRKL
jgi:SAM-dependent methyltransferase